MCSIIKKKKYIGRREKTVSVTEQTIIDKIEELQDEQIQIVVGMIIEGNENRQGQERLLVLQDEIEKLLKDLQKIDLEKAQKLDSQCFDFFINIRTTPRSIEYLKDDKKAIDELRGTLQKLDPNIDKIMYRETIERLKELCENLQLRISCLDIFGELSEKIVNKIFDMSSDEAIRHYTFIAKEKPRTLKSGQKKETKIDGGDNNKKPWSDFKKNLVFNGENHPKDTTTQYPSDTGESIHAGGRETE